MIAGANVSYVLGKVPEKLHVTGCKYLDLEKPRVNEIYKQHGVKWSKKDTANWELF